MTHSLIPQERKLTNTTAVDYAKYNTGGKSYRKLITQPMGSEVVESRIRKNNT